MATQTRRRPYHTGSVVSTGAGKWLVRISVIDPLDGKRRFRARRVSGNKTKAEEALASLRRDVLAEQHGSLDSNIALNGLIERFFQRGSKLAPGTRQAYESLWRKWIETGVGKIPAVDVAAYHYADLWEQMQSAGLSRSTMNGAYALIKGSYRAAAKYDEFAYNTARFLAPPRPEPYMREHLSDETLRAIITATSGMGHYWPFLIRLALATGCRRGELMAMRWGALDDEGWLRVRNSVCFDRGKMVLSNTKNDQPRTIALDDETARWWQSERKRAESLYRESFGGELPGEAFVLAGETSGALPMRPDKVTFEWREICNRAGVQGAEFREMRNWHATTLDIDFDYSLESIGRRLGHSHASSKTRITQRYITTTRERDRRMATDIAARIAEVWPSPRSEHRTSAGGSGPAVSEGGFIDGGHRHEQR